MGVEDNLGLVWRGRWGTWEGVELLDWFEAATFPEKSLHFCNWVRNSRKNIPGFGWLRGFNGNCKLAFQEG